MNWPQLGRKGAIVITIHSSKLRPVGRGRHPASESRSEPRPWASELRLGPDPPQAIQVQEYPHILEAMTPPKGNISSGSCPNKITKSPPSLHSLAG